MNLAYCEVFYFCDSYIQFHMNKISFMSMCLVAILLLSQCCTGEQHNAEQQHKITITDTGRAIAEGHVKVWDESVKQVIELIEYMPESKLDFRPHDSMRTFAEQIVHISISSELITNMFLKDEPRPDNMPEIDANSMDKDELKAFVNEKLGNARNTIESMTDKQLLSETVTSLMGNKMTRLEGMLFATDHLSNHKAKANLYIRLAGHTPPRYRYY